MRRISLLFALLITAALFAVTLAQTLPDGFYRYPSIGNGKIVFASEGDLWMVPASGGVAMRLTAFEGEERFPKISPDGKWIAFTAQYEGNDDVYLIPITGGEPKRMTWHPMPDQAIGWTRDGKILFRSRRDTPHGDYRLFTLPVEGGIAEMIPLEPAAWISWEPNGKRVAYQKIGLEFHNWKRYKGGEAEDLWIGTIDPVKFEWVTKDYPGKDAFPMWHTDGKIYFVTDRWGRPNLASMDPDGKNLKRLTEFVDYDVRWPFMGDGKIVYQHGMDVWVYDVATGKNEQVSIQLPSDRIQVRERFVDANEYLNGYTLSWDGERIALETRGDFFTARTKKKGLIRRITDNSSVRVKFPDFSPDGKWISSWTEVDGEEQLVLYSSDNSAPSKQLGSVAPGWFFPALWSPDGKKLVYTDEKLRLWIVDAESGNRTKCDSANYEIRDYKWSPDSRYVAYGYPLETGYNQIRIYDATTKSVHDVTDPMYNAYSPDWDPQGKYLFFLMDHHINPFLDKFDARFIIDEATLPFAVALQKDGKLLFAPRSDMTTDEEKKEMEKEKEKWNKDDEKGDKKGKGKDDKKDDEKKVEPIKIDFDGLGTRIVQIPVKPGNFYGLAAVEGKLHWIAVENNGMMPAGNPGDDEEDGWNGGKLLTYDIGGEKLSTLSDGVMSYTVSGDKKVLVYHTDGGFYRVEAGAMSAPKDDDAKDMRIDLSGWSLKIDPRKEWRQIFREAWRMQRDFFYDKDMHGVDWNGVWKQYSVLLDRATTRDDINDMIGEMIGELSTGHTYVWGGDVKRGRFVGTGMLGADMKYDAGSGFWQIQKIYAGNYPTEDWSSPLARADYNVKPGTWLVAVDGKPLVKGEDYLKRFANRAGQLVELSVNEKASLDGARRIVVKLLGGESLCRYQTWVNECREYVSKKSGGKIGYIHLYDMGGRGLQSFSREYYPQSYKQGLIMDDRWNHGGFVAPMILSHLGRGLLEFGKPRYGAPYTNPWGLFIGHQICLINRQGGSDCETFANGFQELKLGPVVGMRTWGGLVGIRSNKGTRDGGMTTQPEFGYWTPKGDKWVVEGHGVDPDVLLDLDPTGFLDGKDEQLDYAIDYLNNKIAKEPRKFAPPPPIIPRPLVPVK
ncbi:MAG: PDZ domain-containing protein [bacterium]|nr:PDZ domain-containing protein [bacterium]